MDQVGRQQTAKVENKNRFVRQVGNQIQEKYKSLRNSDGEGLTSDAFALLPGVFHYELCASVVLALFTRSVGWASIGKSGADSPMK